MNYTQNNHLYYTIGDRRFGWRENPHEKFEVFVGKIDNDVYRTSNWREELRKTADSVLSEYGKDLILFLSGGTDSEIVLRNFLEIGFKPRCVLLKFIDGYNSEDADEAVELARCLDVKLDVIDVDILDFYHSGEIYDISSELQCSQIAYLNVYHHVRKLGAPAVMGGEQLLRRLNTQSDDYWYHCYRENQDGSSARFGERYQIPIVNEWFSYTPEMMLYYLEEPGVKKIMTDNNYESSMHEKNVVLQKLFPELRKKVKSHGFEKLVEFNITVTNDLKSRMIPRLTPSLDGISINNLYTMLRGL
jgi:tRNA(Ile)-lysidine synthase TilS/MesJ